jgi:hypothetical protein
VLVCFLDCGAWGVVASWVVVVEGAVDYALEFCSLLGWLGLVLVFGVFTCFDLGRLFAVHECKAVAILLELLTYTSGLDFEDLAVVSLMFRCFVSRICTSLLVQLPCRQRKRIV